MGATWERLESRCLETNRRGAFLQFPCALLSQVRQKPKKLGRILEIGMALTRSVSIAWLTKENLKLINHMFIKMGWWDTKVDKTWAFHLLGPHMSLFHTIVESS